jgi:lipid-A-disaccharide synthase
VNAKFVGHPLADLPRPGITREQYAAENELVASKPWITLMPGSRKKEVRMNLPRMLQAAELLGTGYNFILPVAPTVSKELILQLMREGDDSATASIHLTSDAVPALAHSRAAIVASGTATVEAAMMETPFVMVYRVTPLTYLLGRWTVKVPHFAMVNLIAEQQVVPEFVQQQFTAEKVVAELKRIITDGAPRQEMVAGLKRVKHLLRGESSGGRAPDRAAKSILQLLQTRVAAQRNTNAAEVNQ